MVDPTPHDAFLRTLLRLILAAAILTAPLFLFGEGFEAEYVGRVALSNGACALLCLGLLALVRRGKGALAGSLLVWGLALLVGSLAWGNGEPAHVNVINFVLVTLLASVLGSRREVLLLGALSALEMGVIAWQRPLMPPGKDLAEARFESLVQILPTFLVVVAILWLRAGMAESRVGGGSDAAGADPRP